MTNASDRYGRKPVFIVNAILVSMSLLLSAWANSLFIFNILRFFTGLFQQVRLLFPPALAPQPVHAPQPAFAPKSAHSLTLEPAHTLIPEPTLAPQHIHTRTSTRTHTRT